MPRKSKINVHAKAGLFFLVLAALPTLVPAPDEWIAIRFGQDYGNYDFWSFTLLPYGDNSGTTITAVDVNNKYAELFKMGVTWGGQDLECNSMGFEATYLNGGNEQCFNSPSPVDFFPRPAWDTTFSLRADCYKNSGCSASDTDSQKWNLQLHNVFETSCSTMPYVWQNQPENSYILTGGSWSTADTPKWSYGNNNAATCNCGSWTFYLSTSEATIMTDQSATVSCAAMTAPPPSLYTVGFDLNTWSLAENSAATPWYYWKAVMTNKNGNLNAGTDVRKFCIATAPTLPTLTSPAVSEKIPGTTDGGFPVTFSWTEPSNWGFNCSTNPVSFNLMYDFPQWTTVEWIQTTNANVTISGTAGNNRIVNWKVMARNGAYTQSRTLLTCLENAPDAPGSLLPASDTLHYEDTIGLSWGTTSFNDVCNLNAATDFFFEVYMSTTSPSSGGIVDTLFTTVPSTQTTLDVSKTAFGAVADTGTTVYWQVRAVIRKGLFSRGTRSAVANFNLCTLEKPATPTGLALTPATATCTRGGTATIGAAWTGIADWGAHCSPPAQQTKYMYAVDAAPTAASASTSSTALDLTTSCVNGTHTLSVAAFNGDQLSAGTTSATFTLCEKYNPDAPVPGTPIGGQTVIIPPGSTVASVPFVWSAISDWGRDCVDGSTRGYRVGYRSVVPEGSVSYTTVDENTLTKSISLAKGTWRWLVQAYIGNLYSGVDSRVTFDVCLQTPPSQPVPTFPSGNTVADVTITFEWTSTGWGELCGVTTTTKTFTIVVVHDDGTTLSETASELETTKAITLPKPGLWKWTVTASNGISGVATTTSTEAVFFQGANCLMSSPTWSSGDGLNSPVSAVALVQNDGLVAFDWDSVRSFGMSCKLNQTTFYRLVVDDGAIERTTNVPGLTVDIGAGTHTWRVEAVNENLTTTTATETFSLCIVAQPPVPTLACIVTPQVRPLSVGWSAGWGEMCGQDGEYTVDVRTLDGSASAQTTTVTDIGQHSVEVDAGIPDGNHTWTVTAKIHGLESASTECASLYACTPQSPGKATLGETPEIVFVPTVTLAWSVDAADISSTSCTQFTNATFNASVWVALTDEIVASALVQAGEPMEFAADLFAGDFEWSVNTFNGYQWSEFSDRAAFTICIPEAIGNVSVVSPANNSHPVMQSLVLRWDALPTPASCGNKTTYTVIVGDTALGTTTETDVTADMDALPMLGLVADRLYWWAIRVDTQHYQLTTAPAYFMPCEATAPHAPELAWPTSADVQPAVIRPVAVLEWNQPWPGETCDLDAGMRYTVLLSTDGGFGTFSAFTSEAGDASVGVTGLKDGRYFWKVIASNAAEVGTNESAVEHFDVCIAEGPSAPLLLDPPAKGAILRKAESPAFDISIATTFGRLCRNDSEAAAGYRLYVGADEAEMWASGVQQALSTPESYSANGIPVIRFGNVSLAYGQMFWTAGTTNADGIETRTDEIRLVTVCDAPTGVEQTEPDDRTVDVDVGVTLRWTPAVASLWGFPCAENTGVNPHVSIYIYPVAALHDEDWNETAAEEAEEAAALAGSSASGSEQWWWWKNSTPFVTISNQGNLAEYTLDAAHILDVNTTYAWRVGLHNGYEEKISRAWTFRTEARDCRRLTCLNGGTCDEATITCVCTADWTGEDCSIPVEKKGGNALAIALGISIPLLALIAGAIAIGVCVATRRKKKKNHGGESTKLESGSGAVEVEVAVAASAAKLPEEVAATQEEPAAQAQPTPGLSPAEAPSGRSRSRRSKKTKTGAVAMAEINKPVVCTPETLDFTHHGKDLCRVGEVATFPFAVTNPSGKRVTVEFKPRPSHKWEIAFDPPALTLDPREENAPATCNLKLLCTTVMSGVGVPMVVQGNEIGQLWVSAEGALSAMLDRDEIVLERALGSGSYATVHVGKWRGTSVAVKVFREHLFDIKELAADVRREVDLCMNLRHPNVIQYFGAAISKASACIVMELATNGSLGDAIKEHKLAVAAKFRMAHEVASGMLFLHTSHVIHRDLKPDNVLLMSLDPNAPVCGKLSDFGTSRVIGSTDAARTYTKGVGTPVFCAPEVLDGHRYSSAADVYSFSMLLWNLFSEITPFSEVESIFAMVKMIGEGKRPGMLDVIPEEIRPMIEGTWQTSADERAKFDTIVPELERIMAANGTLPAHMAPHRL